METLELARFFFDIGYATFMDTMFGSIVSGIMIDAFTELKEQDQERDDDKQNNCYICGTEKSEVPVALFRYKSREALSPSTQRRSTCSGTTSTTSTSSSKRVPPTTQGFSSRSSARSWPRKSTGSPPREEATKTQNLGSPSNCLKNKSTWSSQ